ncbi:MAG TPA: alpha/beta hydrolase [Phenylobacterium sp.]|nr:alpha/beta hydrolase [Phenylobacterium sp.]
MARARLAALLFLLLAACNREGATGPFAESRTPPDLGPRFFAPEGWAWGYVQVGRNPPQRYGVASTWRVPRADVVVLPGYGESAETWFETARELTRSGYSVWVLDRAGQGGSGRYALPRDLVHAPSFDPDVAALKALVRVVVRPRSGAPLILMGHAEGAVVALRATETGLAADGLILSSPKLGTEAPAKGMAARIPGLDQLPGPGWKPWSRGQPDDFARGLTHDPWRGAVSKAWQTANPDLRAAGPSLGWRRAFARASRDAVRDAGAARTSALMLRTSDDAPKVAALCGAMPACRDDPIKGARPALHLEADPWRRPWLAAVQTFVAGKVDAARSVGGSATPGDSQASSETSGDTPRRAD